MRRVAAVQMDVALGEVRDNLHSVVMRLNQAAFDGAKLVVFPECALTGYGFRSLEEALPVARLAESAVEAIVARSRDTGATVVVGTLLAEGDQVFNAALVATPDGAPTVYRKCHLPFLGVDKIAGKGTSIEPVATPAGNIGVLICYDIRFPEAPRTLALKGADILCVPTNWPQGAETAPEFVTRARAYENRMYVVAANRVGTERGFTFIGKSQIVDPNGAKLAEADGESETILFAEIDLALARTKKVIIRPDEFEMDLIGDRRPEIYS